MFKNKVICLNNKSCVKSIKSYVKKYKVICLKVKSHMF